MRMDDLRSRGRLGICRLRAIFRAVTRANGMLGDSELCVCVRDCNGCAGHCGEVCGGQAQPSEASVLPGLSLSVIYNSNNNYYYTTVCCCFYFFAALPRLAPTYTKNVC